MCSRPKSQALIASPASGSTIHATPTPISSAATWLGIRMPTPEPDQRPQAQHEQAERDRAQHLGRTGTHPHRAGSSVSAPTETEPTRLTTPYPDADHQQRDHLRQHRAGAPRRRPGRWR